jgi:hypothetical protein
MTHRHLALIPAGLVYQQYATTVARPGLRYRRDRPWTGREIIDKTRGKSFRLFTSYCTGQHNRDVSRHEM